MQTIILREFGLPELEDVIRKFKEELKAWNTELQQDKYLSPKEACNIFQPAISTVTLTNWVKQGLLEQSRMVVR